jgi:hypothetical protein
MFNTQPTKKICAIAGRDSGNPVICSPSAQPTYDALKIKANAGAHWARITVAGLQSLCAGRMHLNNVFIKPCTTVAYGHDEFYLVLPGCKATVEKLPSGEFRVLHIYVDPENDYGKLQEDHEKPGLWRADQNKNKWSTEYVKNGQIKEGKNRVVVITDNSEEPPNIVLSDSHSLFKDAPVCLDEISLNKNGLDMHHTSGKGVIGGMLNARQASMAERDPSLNESALLLAKTMYDARETKDVRWISVQGGSGVLTQAMQILADQRVTLKKHYVQFCTPTTNVYKAITLAQKLELSTTRNYCHKRNVLNPNQLIGGGPLSGYKTSGNRLKNEKDYGLLKFTGDVYQETHGMQAAGATAAVVGSAVGLSAGVVGSPEVLAFLGVVAVVPKITAALLPRIHNKVKDKL